MRKKDYEPRKVNPDSPFRCFNVKCLKCDCYKMTVTAHYDEQSGESFIPPFNQTRGKILSSSLPLFFGAKMEDGE
jgi:hypothetical protein